MTTSHETPAGDAPGPDAAPATRTRLETLEANLRAAFGESLRSLDRARGELTLIVSPVDYVATATALRDDPAFGFEQ
jgi:NADH-quinone oxidoreductase subunit C